MNIPKIHNHFLSDKEGKRRLALYWPWIYLRSGVERCIVEYLKRSRHDWTILTNHFDKDATYPEFAKFDVIELSRVSVDRNPLKALKAAIIILFQKVDLSRFDALFLHSGDLGDLFAVRNRFIPVICYCHSPIRPVYDPTYREEYLKRNRGNALLFWVLWLTFRLIGPVAWGRYKFVFCNSHWIERRILINRLCQHERLKVLHPGVDTTRISPSNVWEHFFLVPGRIMWLKNIELAIRAFRIFRENSSATKQFQLIVAGMVDQKSRAYLKQLQEQFGDIPDIRWVLNPSDKVLFSLYERCYAVLFTPLAEDWGIVPLEAMAHGKPVVAVNRGGPTESIVPDKTGFLLPPDEKAFADTMLTLVQKRWLAEQMGFAGRKRVKAFDWEYYTKCLDDFFSQLPARHPDLFLT